MKGHNETTSANIMCHNFLSGMSSTNSKPNYFDLSKGQISDGEGHEDNLGENKAI